MIYSYTLSILRELPSYVKYTSHFIADNYWHKNTVYIRVLYLDTNRKWKDFLIKRIPIDRLDLKVTGNRID